MLLFMVLDMILFMALDMFFMDLDIFLRFFYGFGNGVGQNRTKIVNFSSFWLKKTILGTLVAFTFVLRFFYDFGTVPYENRKKTVNKS